MNATQYAEYQARFTDMTAGLVHLSTGGCPGCEECGLPDEPTNDEYDMASEGHFSWSPCHTCDSDLGGDRYAAHAHLDRELQLGLPSLIHLSVCADCLYYINYGRLDDATMLAIEEVTS